MEREIREKNKVLFHRLLSYAARNEFTDDYLQTLIEFWQLLPENETEGNIFYAQYALHYKNHAVAYEYAYKAYAKRKINWRLWQILRDVCYGLGKWEEALFYAGCADKFYKEPVLFDIPRYRLEKALDIFSLAMGVGNYAPVATSRMRMTEKGIEAQESIFAGEFLPQEIPDDKYRLFAGAYVEQEMLDNKGRLLEFIKDVPDMAMISGADFVYDLVKVADCGKQHEVYLNGEQALIGLVGSREHQRVEFYNKNESTLDYLGKWAVSFFALEDATTLVSENRLLCTAPVFLKHDARRCKVVLNILLDGFCWRAVQEKDFELVPNILRFFSKGVIFNNHYSVSEYTFPSLATIETGLYPYHSQIFNAKASHSLNREYLSISERMHELGYYCVNIMGDGTGVYNGTMRGYDRLIVNAYDNRVYQGVERTIHHIEAFSGTDQFIFLHAADTHPWGAHKFQLPLTTQTAFALAERSMKEEKPRTSVYLPSRPIYHHWNSQGIKDCDRALETLFAFLEENYNDDEFLVSVYSDHGVPIYDEKNYILSEHQTGAAFMMRGHGVPSVGAVCELTSALDIYSSLGKCLDFSCDGIDGNLPAVLGGKEREYVVSMSIFPRSPYMICIRTSEYECRAESREITDEDGRVDLADMKISICRRDTGETIQQETLERYFRDILRRETRMIDNWGTQWPQMRQARKAWFAEK